MTGPPRVACLSIGDELLIGRHPDLDAPQVAAAMVELGAVVDRVEVLADDEDAIVEAIGRLAGGRRLIAVSGGLGPTLDDLTRHAIARAAGVDLEHSEGAWAGVRAWFERRGIEPPVSNRRQALIPVGAEVLPNARGTAPGFLLELEGGTLVAALPGPPSELAGMLEAELVPRLRKRLGGGGAQARAEFSLFGLSESHFAEHAADWMERRADPRMGVSARDGVLIVGLTSPDRDAVDARAAEFRARFGDWIYAERDESLASTLGRRLMSTGTTCAFAESCTGGGVGRALTSVSGISAVLLEGWVTYTNAAKSARLGVPKDLLERRGAVSAEVAGAMAFGAADRSGADLAVATTGIAGPDGGSDSKPVGLVYVGVAHRGRVWTVERRFPPVGRDRVRRYTEQAALFAGLAAIDGRLEAIGAEPAGNFADRRS